MTENLESQWAKRNKLLEQRKKAKEATDAFEFKVFKNNDSNSKSHEIKPFQSSAKNIPLVDNSSSIAKPAPTYSSSNSSKHTSIRNSAASSTHSSVAQSAQSSSQHSASISIHSSAKQSAQTSRQSSRVQSPVITKREPSPLKPPKKVSRIPQRLKIAIAALIALASIVTAAVLQYDTSAYCSDNENDELSRCRKCPKNANCSLYSFKCKEGFVKRESSCISKKLEDEYIHVMNCLRAGEKDKEKGATLEKLMEKSNDQEREFKEADIKDVIDSCNNIFYDTTHYFIRESNVIHFELAFIAGIWTSVIVLVVLSCMK